MIQEILILASKVPWEKIFIQSPDMDVEKLKALEVLKKNPTPSKIELASTTDTIIELKRRAGDEIYGMELDLRGGGRINGKPCDCLSHKHRSGIESTIKELMSYEFNPAYQQILDWYNRHAPEFEPEAIVNHPVEYYQALIPELRVFRKLIAGTESLKSLSASQEPVVASSASDEKSCSLTENNLELPSTSPLMKPHS
jgi:hypothetical protein